ncbi:MAG: hypothetical protein R6X20_06595 [Phycisphaerae bacterium]
MPERVQKIFRRAIETYPYDGRRKAEERARNLEALDQIREGPWPDLGRLKRVRLHFHSDLYERDFTATAWRVHAAEGAETDGLLLVAPDLTARPFPAGAFTRVEPVDYAEELATLVRVLEKPESERPDEWDLVLLPGGGGHAMRFHSTILLLHHAYAAAWLGREDEAGRLLRELLGGGEAAFAYACTRLGDRWFLWGTRMLSEDRPWAGVLDQWRETLRYFPNWRYPDQLREVVSRLEEQVPEMARLAETDVADPAALPPQERIACYAARLPEVRGAQTRIPGSARALRMGQRTRVSDALVAIGRPAVPALLDRLDDRRITRSVADSLAPKLAILRVQDVAIQCIEAIVDLQFYRPSTTSSSMSSEAPQIRETVIEDIRTWWQEHGQKSALAGFLGRLNQTENLRRRIATLGKIEATDADAVDSVARLKEWAVEANRSGLRDIIEALLERGDTSLLPAAMEAARRALRDGRLDCVRTLLDHGGPDDFRVLREAVERERARVAAPESSALLKFLRYHLPRVDRPVAVPLLVDCLGDRRLTKSRQVLGRKERLRFSAADDCMQALIDLTGHDAGYRKNADAEARLAAIDRWLAWWKREGREAFLAAHPAVRKVAEGGGRRIARLDPADLPPSIWVQWADADTPIACRVPRESLVRLFTRGDVQARAFTDGSDAPPAPGARHVDHHGRPVTQAHQTFRFTSRDAAWRWFEQAHPLPAETEPDRQPLACLGASGNIESLTLAPGGRAWLWDAYPKQEPDIVRRRVEEGAASDRPAVTVGGAQILLIDPRDRVWLTRTGDAHRLLACDPAARRWLHREAGDRDAPVPTTDAKGRRLDPLFTGSAYASRAGRLFFADRFGLHVLHDDTWSYHPLVRAGEGRNRPERTAPEGLRNLEFREDEAGTLYVWATEGRDVGGLTVFDGQRWHDLPVPGIPKDVVPVGPGRAWVIGEGPLVYRVENGRVAAEHGLADLLPEGLRARTGRFVAASGGRVYFYLEDVTRVRPLEKREGAAMVLHPDGTVETLGETAAAFLRTYALSRTVGPDGWIWQSGDGFLQGMSPDGRQVLTRPTVRHLTHIRVRAVDEEGTLYLHASRHWWRLRPPGEAEPAAAQLPRLPAVRTGIHGLAWPDDRGRMWCTWDRPDHRVSHRSGSLCRQ